MRDYFIELQIDDLRAAVNFRKRQAQDYWEKHCEALELADGLQEKIYELQDILIPKEVCHVHE